MPLVVDRLELGPIQTNCFVVRTGEYAPEAVVVDPGGDAQLLLAHLGDIGARCAGILVTHGHFDHIGGVADLAEATDVDVYMPDADRDMLERYRDYAPPEIAGRPYKPDVLLHGGEMIDVAGISFETIPIPGHTRGHVAFYADNCLFSGDLLFAGGVGRVDLPGGDWATLLTSVRELNDRFPADTVVYPGHGPKTTLGFELERNPFLAELRA
jgi:hydroxyacylglutathione hydrolase